LADSERDAGRERADSSALAPELEARIAALETAASCADFDRPSWFWMILFGIVVPAILLIIGWWA
jgi:hypothetical protein